MRSSIEIYNIRTRQMRVVWQTPELFEAPNWSPDGTYLLLNADGLLYRLPLSGDVSPQKVDTGFATTYHMRHIERCCLVRWLQGQMQFGIALLQDHEANGTAVFEGFGKAQHAHIKIVCLLDILDGKHRGNTAEPDRLIGNGIHRETSKERGRRRRTVPVRCHAPNFRLQDSACDVATIKAASGYASAKCFGHSAGR